MNEPQNHDIPFVTSVFHPSDFSKESEQAFAHALAITLRQKAKLTIIHVDDVFHNQKGLLNFPSIRSTLERWGYLEKGSPRSAVYNKLGIMAQKLGRIGRHPIQSILDYLHENPTDLIVLATEGREGLARWIHTSVAEQIARKSKTMTLFVPNAVCGFVSFENGSASLRKILLPIDHNPDPHAAIIHASRIAGLFGNNPVEITLIHVSDSADIPAVDLAKSTSLTWKTINKRGKVVEEIINAAHEFDVDLIVMTTQGHKGVFDAIRGSVTEQVLRHAPCPVLAVPTGRR